MGRAEQLATLQQRLTAGQLSAEDPRVQQLIAAGLLDAPKTPTWFERLRQVPKSSLMQVAPLAALTLTPETPEQEEAKRLYGAVVRSATLGVINPLAKAAPPTPHQLPAEIAGELAGYAVPFTGALKGIKGATTLARLLKGGKTAAQTGKVLEDAGLASRLFKAGQTAAATGAVEAASEALQPGERPLLSELAGLSVPSVARIPARAAEGSVLGLVGEAGIAGGRGLKALRAPSDMTRARALWAGIGESLTSRLQKLGPAGQELAQRIATVEEQTAQRAGHATTTTQQALKSLSPAELENMVDVLDQGVRPINPAVQTAVEQIQPRLRDVAQQAAERVPGFRQRTQYFPHQYPKETLQKVFHNRDFLQEKATALVQSGKYATVPEAEEAIKTAFRHQLGGRRFGNLDFPRDIELPGWIRDPNVVLPRYFRGAYRRLAELEHFGPGDTHVRELITGIERTVGPRAGQYARDALRSVVKDFDFLRTLEDASSTVRTVQVWTKLGLAQLTNLGQTANTYVQTGLAPTIAGIRAAFTREGTAFAENAGALLNTIHEDLATSSAADRFLRWTGFEAVERWNRVVAANAGKVYAQRQLSVLLKHPTDAMARRRLTELGIDVDAAMRKGLAQTDLERAAFRINKRAQFTSRPEDLPLFWTDPMGKVLTQFKTFAFQHGQFVKEAIVRELRQGNPGPLIRSLIAAGTLGEVIVDAKQLARGKSPAKERKGQSLWARELENWLQLGGFGLFTDLWQSAQYGRGAVVGSLAGPTVSTVGEAIEAGTQAAQGKPRAFAKVALRQVPVVGPTAANLLFPKQRTTTSRKKRPTRKDNL